MSINFWSAHEKKSHAKSCQALKTWVRLVNVGRQKIDQQHWQEATTMYLLAHTICKKLSATETTPNFLDFYLRTQMELIFVLRKSNYPIEITLLESNIKTYLERLESQKILHKPVSELIKPINDVVNGPINNVNLWVSKCIAVNQLKFATVH